VLHFTFGTQYLPVRVCTQLAAWVLSCPSYWGLPLCISVDTPGSSPHPLHYIVFPLPPLILVPVTVHRPCDPTIPCSVVCEQALRKELLLDIPVAYLVIVECCVLSGHLAMEAAGTADMAGYGGYSSTVRAENEA
jgi:hypothetical protein